MPKTISFPKEGGSGSQEFYREDAIYNKAAASPIPVGGQVSGVILIKFRNAMLSDLRPNGKLTLEFQDVKKNKYTVTMNLVKHVNE
jgi:hypothetical protein